MVDKDATDQARSQELFFRAAMNNIKHGLCFFDGQSRLIVCNGRYAEMYGLGPDETAPGTELARIIQRRQAVGSGPTMSDAAYLAWPTEAAAAGHSADVVVPLQDGRTIGVHYQVMADGGWVATHEDITNQIRDAEHVSASEERYRALIRASAVIEFRAGRDGAILEACGWDTFCGQRFEAYRGSGWLEAVHPDDRDRVVAKWSATLASGSASENEFRVLHLSGEYRWVLSRAVALRSPDGTVREWVGALTDIHERKIAEQNLREGEQRLRLALRAGRMVPWQLNRTTGWVTRGETSWSVLGIGSGPLSQFLEAVHDEDRQTVERFLKSLGTPASHATEFRYQLPSGRIIWLGSRGETTADDGLIGVTFDISDRKRSEEEARWIASHDHLTGLPNRALFQSRFETALAEAARNDTSVSLLMVDLDDFKDVNDTLGHDAGDALLMEVAERLASVTRDCDTVARLGGDEFALIVVDPLRLEHAVRLAEAIVERLREPFNYEGSTLSVRGSIGLASYPEHDRCPHELMKDADIALYRAKTEGRSRVVTYDTSLRRSIEERVFVVREMRGAVGADQIVPFYQPKVCLLTGRIVGFEALARWIHPSRGLLTPAAFSSAFDDAELANLIGANLVRQVARDVRAWLDRGLDCGRVAVNVSSAEFSNPDLAGRLLRTLADAGVPTHHFEVEVTETVFLGRNSERTAQALRRLHEAGVQIALDDFGTGFASLTHLKQFPVDHIKIDQTFIRDLGRSDDDAAIVRAVVGLGTSLNLQVTAEGVETVEQAERLRRKGCPYAQGYLYAKPMAGSRVPWFITDREARIIDAPQRAWAS